MNKIHQATPRPDYPDLAYSLNHALMAADATGEALAAALRFPLSVDRTRLLILANALRAAADSIDPTTLGVNHV